MKNSKILGENFITSFKPRPKNFTFKFWTVYMFSVINYNFEPTTFTLMNEPGRPAPRLVKVKCGNDTTINE